MAESNYSISQLLNITGESSTEQWLRKWLRECFADDKKTYQFVIEKRQRLKS